MNHGCQVFLSVLPTESQMVEIIKKVGERSRWRLDRIANGGNNKESGRMKSLADMMGRQRESQFIG